MSDTDREAIGGALITAAVLLALSMTGSAYRISQSFDRTAEKIGQIADGIGSGPGGVAQEIPVAGSDRVAQPNSELRYAVQIGAAPSRGNSEAAVTIVEWADFQCPFCGRVNSTLDEIRKIYGEKVRLVFKHMPLDMHAQAPAAHAAAEAAHRQGQFWSMHDRIFASPRDLSPATFVSYAREIGLDLDRFDRDIKSPSVASRIADDVVEAGKLGVRGTPSFFINGRFLSGAQPFESFKRAIDEELRKLAG